MTNGMHYWHPAVPDKFPINAACEYKCVTFFLFKESAQFGKGQEKMHLLIIDYRELAANLSSSASRSTTFTQPETPLKAGTSKQALEQLYRNSLITERESVLSSSYDYER